MQPLSGYTPRWILPSSLFGLRRDEKDGVYFAMLFTLRESRGSPANPRPIACACGSNVNGLTVVKYVGNVQAI